MSAPLRKKLFVDPRVQGALMIRAVLYWLCCLTSIIMFVICWRIVTGPARVFYTHFDDLWFHMGPALVASLLILPLVLVDVLRLSNRFVGPLYRIRVSLRQMARGEHVDPISFREDDFWQEVAEEFNAMSARVQYGESTARRPMQIAPQAPTTPAEPLTEATNSPAAGETACAR